jgi:hypothetical protein
MIPWLKPAHNVRFAALDVMSCSELELCLLLSQLTSVISQVPRRALSGSGQPQAGCELGCYTLCGDASSNCTTARSPTVVTFKHSIAPPDELSQLSHVYISPHLLLPTWYSAHPHHLDPTMAYNKGFNPDRLPMHAEPEQVSIVLCERRRKVD